MMNKFYTAAALFATTLVLAQAGAPASPYYNGFNWSQTGMSLKAALATKITNTHTHTLSYQDVEDADKIIDLDPTDATHTNVLLVYGFSPNICPSSTSDDSEHRRRNKNADGAGTSCEWNREHVFAKSLGTPDLGTSGPGSDAHHIRAADVDRNGDRASEKFASSTGNSHDVTSATWYPGDEWKGDVARMIMYMYLRYGSQCLPKNVGVGSVLSTDSNMIDLFLQWNAEDPVSAVEDQRNTYLGNASNTYGQGNRNPFIDNPYLATVIWGGPVAQNRWPSIFLATDAFDLLGTVSVFPNPSHDGTINISGGIKLDDIAVISVNGQIIMDFAHPAMDDNKYTLNGLPQGFYFLKLTSGSNTTVKKIIVQ